MKSGFQSVIFDFDGTLVNTEYFHYQCTYDLLKQLYGKSMSYDYYNEKLLGKPTSTSIFDVISDFDLDIEAPELLKMIEHHTGNRLMQHDVELMPFTEEAIQFFHNSNVPISIVTGSQMRSVSFILSRKKMEHHFREIVTFDDVTNSKPHPEPYNLCVEKLGVKKDEVLVFEDTENGVKSAKAAGLTCFAVQSDDNLHSSLSKADHLFTHLGEAIEFLTDKE